MSKGSVVPKFMKITLRFSSKKLRFLIHFESIFVCGVIVAQLYYFARRHPLTPFAILSLLKCLGTFVQN